MAFLPSSRRWRLVLAALIVLILLPGIGLYLYRQAQFDDLDAAWASFEQQIGPLSPEDFQLEGATTVDPEIERFRQARQVAVVGRQAFDAGQLDDALAAVEELESIRATMLDEDARLVDLIMAHGTGRFALDLAADLLEAPQIQRPALDRLRHLFDPAGDHLGVDDALTYESEFFLSQTTDLPPESGLANRLYFWLYGAADRAASLRLYLAMNEAMHEPILDVGDYLRQRSIGSTGPFRIVSTILIPNLQEVPLDHRLETTGRRLVRWAADVTWAQSTPGPCPEEASTALQEIPSDAVSGGQGAVTRDAAGAPVLAFPEAIAIRDARPPRQGTAPPLFPLSIRLLPARCDGPPHPAGDGPR